MTPKAMKRKFNKYSNLNDDYGKHMPNTCESLWFWSIQDIINHIEVEKYGTAPLGRYVRDIYNECLTEAFHLRTSAFKVAYSLKLTEDPSTFWCLAFRIIQLPEFDQERELFHRDCALMFATRLDFDLRPADANFTTQEHEDFCSNLASWVRLQLRKIEALQTTQESEEV